MKQNVFDRVPFTLAHNKLLSSISKANLQVKYVVDNAENILIRVNTVSLSGNVDTFVMDTSAQPNDEMVYTTDRDTLDLNQYDAGLF